MSQVEIRLFGHLRQHLPEPGSSGAHLDVPEGDTVGKLIDRLGISPEDPKVILVNGVHTDLKQTLRDGDRVSIFPPIAGG